jgi:energy-coupling factor transport system permease protein
MIFEYIAPNIGSATILLAISTVIFSLLKCTNIFMLGTFLIKTTPVTEIICALETMKAPDQIVIPFAVAVRFIPSIREDFNCLKDSLRIRNIPVSLWSFLRHPIQTIEYMLVPILMRSYKISEELAASSMIRGLDSGKPKTMLYTIKFGIQDFITSVFWIGFIFLLLYYQHRAN